MLDNLYGDITPGTFTAVTIQTNGAYGNSAWQTARTSYYGVSGTPTMWFDGAQSVVGAGSTSSAYNAYHSAYDTRRDVATDVTIQLGGTWISGQTYEIKAKVGIDAGGAGKTMRIYLVQVLDNWPNPPTHTPRYGFVQAATVHGSEDQVTVSPGQFQIVTRNFTFSGDSWTHQSDIKIVAWAAPQSPSNKVIYQAATMPWPFTPLGPPLGDMDGSMVVDMNDVDDFVLALVDLVAYEALHPDLDPVALGDINDDGLLDGNDIYPFMVLVVEALGGDISPPTPNPMTFATAPTPNGATPTTAIDMVASVASDPTTPVQYAFEALTGPEYPGADSRGWGVGRTYSDEGLTPNTTYGYRVQARDGYSTPNVTEWSSMAYTTTYARPPGQPFLADATSTAMTIDVALDDGTTPHNPDYTELAIQCTATADGAWNGKWVDASGYASATPAWRTDAQWAVTVIEGLQPSTSYTFAVKARNLASIETDFGPSATLSTTP